MNLRGLIALAKAEGASDLHLEPGLAPVLRVRSHLRSVGEPVTAGLTVEWAREIIGADEWPRFLQRRSFDLSRTIEGLRCRINILHTARGVGLAVRLLPAFQPTVESLNLHPDLKQSCQSCQRPGPHQRPDRLRQIHHPGRSDSDRST